MSLWQILVQYRPALLHGLLVTGRLCLIAWSVGLIIGSALGASSARWPKAIGGPLKIISFVFSGLPVLLILFVLHYPVQAALGVVIDPFLTASVVLSIACFLAVNECVRHELTSLPQEYVVAAKVCGLSAVQTLRYIELPIVVRRIIPTLLTIQVNILQSSLFASLIGVDELFRTSQRINSEVYQPVTVYAALGLFMLLICLPLNAVAYGLRRKFARDLSDR